MEACDAVLSRVGIAEDHCHLRGYGEEEAGKGNHEAQACVAGNAGLPGSRGDPADGSPEADLELHQGE